MKKFLLGSALLVTCMAVQAAGITVISTSSRNSPTTTVATTFKENLPGSTFYQADNCIDGINKFNSTPNSILTFGTTLAFSAVAKGQTCRPAINDKNVVFYAEQFFKICTKKGSNKNFRSPGATFGIPSVMLPDPLVNDINKQNRTTLKALPFSGSKDILLQIMSGDLDLGLLGKSAAQKPESMGVIECLAGTNPSDPDFIGKQLKMKIPDLRIPVVLLKNGVNDPADVDRVKKALESEGFVGLLNQGDFISRTTVSDRALLERINGWLDRYIKNHITDATK
jgi:hypothetical protein